MPFGRSLRTVLGIMLLIVCGACSSLSIGPLPFETTAPVDGTSVTIERRGQIFDVRVVAPASATHPEVVVIFPAGRISSSTPMTEIPSVEPGKRLWGVGIQPQEPGTYTFRVTVGDQRLVRTADNPKN